MLTEQVEMKKKKDNDKKVGPNVECLCFFSLKIHVILFEVLRL